MIMKRYAFGGHGRELFKIIIGYISSHRRNNNLKYQAYNNHHHRALLSFVFCVALKTIV